MKKKVFISLLTTATIISLISVPTTLVSLAYALPNVYEETFLGELKYKYDLLSTTTKKKVVFIGGSSIPFGLRSSYIEDYFKSNLKEDYKVVDFGMYAALGTKIMLDLAIKHVSSGDIIIISPEQQEQTLSLYFNGKMMWQALDGRMSLFNKIANEDKVKMAGDYFTFIQDKIDLMSHEIDLSNDIYSRASFDEYGDIASEICEYNKMLNHYDKNMEVRFDEGVISSDFISYLNNFSKEASKKGATTYYRFSPMNELAIIGDVDKYYDFLNEKLEFDILGNPHDAIMDYEYFYDTNFHLNNVGAILNTSNIIKELKLVYNDAKPFDIDIPQKPIIKEEEVGSGDNSMISYFKVNKTGNSAIIEELVNKNIDKIILPYSIDDIRIETFSDNTFKNNANLKEITIQNNIKSIPSNAFSGCSSLKKIVILNDKPSSVLPGDELLGNTNADIYVPSNALSAYKTNYFWSLYSTRIKAIEGEVKL